MSDPHDTGTERATFLPYMLGAVFGLFFLTFLIVITGGFFLWVALVVAFFAAMGWFQYWLWGKALSDRTAGEREEAELLERAREQPEDSPYRR